MRLRKEFVHNILAEAVNRADVDSIVDVHTHPFSEKSAWFSGEDDRDETTFCKFISEHFENLHYASIVLSQREYAARMWQIHPETGIAPRKAIVKTQTAMEQIPSSDFSKGSDSLEQNGLLKDQEAVHDRSVRALGLDAMRRIVDKQIISVTRMIAQEERQKLSDGAKSTQKVVFPIFLRLDDLAQNEQELFDLVLDLVSRDY